MLITLAIIGVVAALTIPTLIKNYQQHQYIVQLKKVQNTLNKAVYMYIAQGGKIVCDRNGDYGLGIRANTDCILGSSKCDEIEGIKKNLSIFNIDKETAKKYKINNLPIYGINGEKVSSYSSDYTFLKDGATFKFSTTSGYMLGNLPKGYCWGFVVDVNGPLKKPNRVGYDFFGFYLSDKGQVIPVGSNIVGKNAIYEAWGYNDETDEEYTYNKCTSLNELGGGLCATASAISGKNPDGTEYWKGIKYWNDIE